MAGPQTPEQQKHDQRMTEMMTERMKQSVQPQQSQQQQQAAQQGNPSNDSGQSTGPTTNQGQQGGQQQQPQQQADPQPGKAHGEPYQPKYRPPGRADGQQIQQTQPEGLDNKQQDSQVNTSEQQGQQAQQTNEGQDGQITEDDVARYILDEKYGGDENKLHEAKAVANLTLKTFNRDPVNAAKSYYHLSQQKNQQDQLLNYIQNNPVTNQILEAVQQGHNVDETFLRNLIQQNGGAAPADQPHYQQQGSTGQGQLVGNQQQQPAGQQPQAQPGQQQQQAPQGQQSSHHHGMRLSQISEDELMRNGYLDAGAYNQATQLDKKEMLLNARMAYAEDTFPDRVMEKVEQKQQQQAQQQRLQQAEQENRERAEQSKNELVRKYELDFQNNPVHQNLLRQAYQKAPYWPDPEDPESLRIRPDALEQAVLHEAKNQGIELQPVQMQQQQQTDQQGQQQASQPQSYDKQRVQQALQTQGVNLSEVPNRGTSQPAQSTKQDLSDRVQQASRQQIVDRNDRSRMTNAQRYFDRRQQG